MNAREAPPALLVMYQHDLAAGVDPWSELRPDGPWLASPAGLVPAPDDRLAAVGVVEDDQARPARRRRWRRKATAA